MGQPLPGRPVALVLVASRLTTLPCDEEHALDQRIQDALATDRTIDITTTGRASGLPRRIETWFYRVDDRLYLTGSPGRRD